jgi:capsular exopolysaccharide synthesis family protein
MEQAPEALDFQRLLSMLVRRLPLIVLCVAVVGGVAYGVSKHQTKKYTATASLSFGTNALEQQVAGVQTPTVNAASQQANDVELVKVGSTAEATALKLGLSLATVGEGLSVSGRGESNIVDVSASSSSPSRAAAIANTYAALFVKEQAVANRRSLRSALALVQRQLKEMTRAQRFGQDGLTLQQRAQTLRLLAGLDYGNVRLAERATPPSAPTSPKTSRNAALGGLLGLVIGLGIAFLLERADRRIRRPDELKDVYGAPLLGVVPNSSSLSSDGRRRGGTLPHADAEAFHLIRSHLKFYNVDRDLRTLMVVSPSPGDGKTTIARNLAEAAARVGSRALLLEGDLRHPMLAARFAAPPSPGLTDVLVGAVRFDEAIRSFDVDSPAGEGAEGRRLDVLVAGTVPPNPGELLESYAMGIALARAKSIYDVVIIDTSPLDVVSDAFSLIPRADGVIIVGRLGRSRRDVADRLRQVLTGSGAFVLGVIANGGPKSGALGAYAKPQVAPVPRETTPSSGRPSEPASTA